MCQSALSSSSCRPNDIHTQHKVQTLFVFVCVKVCHVSFPTCIAFYPALEHWGNSYRRNRMNSERYIFEISISIANDNHVIRRRRRSHSLAPLLFLPLYLLCNPMGIDMQSWHNRQNRQQREYTDGKSRREEKKQTNHVDQNGIVVLRLIIPGKRIKKIASEKMIFRFFFTIIEPTKWYSKEKRKKWEWHFVQLCRGRYRTGRFDVYDLDMCNKVKSPLKKKKTQQIQTGMMVYISEARRRIHNTNNNKKTNNNLLMEVI